MNKTKKIKINWQEMNWDLSNEEIAKQVGLSERFVYVNRKMYASHTITNVRKSKKEINWAGVDWTKSNYDIAKQVGCAYNTVLIYRAIFGKGVTPAQKRALDNT